MSARQFGLHTPTVRVGMPLVSGQLLEYGIASGLPLMFSANAFARTNPDKEFVGFNLAAASALPVELDAFLDSAGFVAASHFGDFRWSIDEYLDLAAARPWTHYSAMDYCVEPQVAPDAATRRLRVDATIARYFQCANRAAQRGLPQPSAVIQGYYADEYARCAEALQLPADAALVGVGSVCRRHLHGPDGVLAIMEAVDAALPWGVKVHLYGLKGSALPQLLNEFPNRIGSTDSMAWDLGVRRACPVGRTQAMRAKAMVDWHAREMQRVHQRSTSNLPRLPAAPRVKDFGEIAAEAVGRAFGALHATNDLSYADARHHLSQDAVTVRALLANSGPAAFFDVEPEDDFGLGVVYDSVRAALVEAGLLCVDANS